MEISGASASPRAVRSSTHGKGSSHPSPPLTAPAKKIGAAVPRRVRDASIAIASPTRLPATRSTVTVAQTSGSTDANASHGALPASSSPKKFGTPSSTFLPSSSAQQHRNASRSSDHLRSLDSDDEVPTVFCVPSALTYRRSATDAADTFYDDTPRNGSVPRSTTTSRSQFELAQRSVGTSTHDRGREGAYDVSPGLRGTSPVLVPLDPTESLMISLLVDGRYHELAQFQQQVRRRLLTAPADPSPYSRHVAGDGTTASRYDDATWPSATTRPVPSSGTEVGKHDTDSPTALLARLVAAL